MIIILLLLNLSFLFTGIDAEFDSKPSNSNSSFEFSIDLVEDFDLFEVIEYEDPKTKNYHCTPRNLVRNKTFVPDLERMKLLNDHANFSMNKTLMNNEFVRHVRRRLCQFGFDPFRVAKTNGTQISIHRKYKNALHLMVYNTPSLLPNLRLVRNDLDRKRRREPHIWYRFELTTSKLETEFDFDNYFFTVSGDISRVHAFSKLLVALKRHKRLNGFSESIVRKVNLDLGIMEAILSSFGIWVMREKSLAKLMVKALNGIRTEPRDAGEVQLLFDDTFKEAADSVNPLLYAYVWLLSQAEKYEVVQIKDSQASETA